MNLSLRQVQKYEEGIDRLGASRLFDISRILEVPIAYFFQDLADGPEQVAGTQEMSAPETKDLVQAYYRISDPKVRRYVYLLTKTTYENLPFLQAIHKAKADAQVSGGREVESLVLACIAATARSRLAGLAGSGIPAKSATPGQGARWMLGSPRSSANAHDQISSVM